MAELSKMTPQIRIGQDEMEAFLYLPVPKEKKYTKESLKSILQEGGVVFGIDEDVLEKMVTEPIYNREMQVAVGIPVQDGIDGYYEYHFRRNLDGKPKIRPDGSVDYWSIQKVEIAKAGQVIACYHPAVMGTDGMTVKGKPLHVKRARELPPIKGKGFTRSEDNRTYTANFDGKIEMQNDRIMILQVYEISGDADLSVGNIDFNGDVIIHGNVRTGVNIKAGGNITVDGIVECAQLWSGKDIILRGGMMGESKSKVYAKGSISAKFFEFTSVEAGGSIQAEVFLSCNVFCKEKVILSGKKAGIVGGTVRAVQGIETGNLGNDVEIRTEVQVGNDVEIFRRIRELEKKNRDAQKLLEKLEEGLKKFEKLEEEQLIKRDDPRKIQLLRVKVRETAVRGANQAELERLMMEVQCAKGASVKVVQNVYPGVRITIDSIRYHVKEAQYHVGYRKCQDEVIQYQLVT